jgi:hypothetical protein
MSLRGRLNRLEGALGDEDTPKRITVSTVPNRHEIRRDGPARLTLGIPWRPGFVRGGGDDPLGALTEEQRALIGPHAWVALLCLPSRRSPNLAGEEWIS